MVKRMIDPVKLHRMVTAGKNGREIADHFGVSESAVSQARKQLRVNVTKVVALENAHKFASENLDAAAQLRKINEHTNQLIDLLVRWCAGDEEALEILKNQHSSKRVSFRDPKELLIRLFAEVREQLSLQLQIFTSLYDARAAQDFQTEVLAAIAEETPHVRDKIISRLNQGKALRRSFS